MYGDERSSVVHCAFPSWWNVNTSRLIKNRARIFRGWNLIHSADLTSLCCLSSVLKSRSVEGRCARSWLRSGWVHVLIKQDKVCSI